MLNPQTTNTSNLNKTENKRMKGVHIHDYKIARRSWNGNSISDFFFYKQAFFI